MKFTKILCLMLALLMLTVSFAACGSDANENGAAPAGDETAADAGKLIMATNAAFPPYEFKEGEEIVGIDAEIAAAIAENLGMELVIEDMEFDSIITAVTNDKSYVGIAGLTVTDERKKEVNFSDSYATGVQVVIVKEGSDIVDLDGLTGKKIGVQLGTTGDIYASGDYGDENVIRYGKGADAIIALQGGDVDAVIIDNEPAKNFVANNEGLTILETEYAIEDYAIAINKDNAELLDKINGALAELTADGTIDAIIEKYIPVE
ncbi:MAG: transporter substrate-binding domain-containing protein [Clostridia bacterium]|nr:transporter substrate-binding domain-containing protein [Clostridia bacterium]